MIGRGGRFLGRTGDALDPHPIDVAELVAPRETHPGIVLTHNVDWPSSPSGLVGQRQPG
jgi:hypothetical protein